MASTLIDRTGQAYGRLMVIERDPDAPGRHARWICTCLCGRSVSVRGTLLASGETRSCGCLHADVTRDRTLTHGMSHSPTWRSWASMKARCTNPLSKSWQWYGGRGVTVCAGWLVSFDMFLADMGVRPDGTTLDRIDSDGNYEPANCRWATRQQQSENQARRGQRRPA